MESLYEEYYLYRFLLLQGCRPNDAGDYLQESFLRLLRFLKRGDRVDKPKSWLLRAPSCARTITSCSAHALVSLTE